MRKIVAGIMALIAVFSLSSCGEKGDRHGGLMLEDAVDFTIEVESGRAVKILQLTDIQIIDSSQRRTPDRLPSWSIENWAPENVGKLAYEYMRKTVAKSNPDLIVLSGDNVYGEFDDNGSMLDSLIAEMDSYGVPWTVTFGNHDNETKLGVEKTCRKYAAAKNCLFRRGDTENVEGNGNFNVGIVQGGELTGVVWLMDSNGHTDSDSSQNMYSYVGLMDGQKEWFRNGSEKLKTYNGGKNLPAIGFFHHPLRAYGDGLQKYGYLSSRHDFFTEDGDYGNFSPVLIPENGEGDSGNMNADAGQYIDGDYVFHNMLKQYGVLGWFFGHDHLNNASVSYNGIRYTYGLKASLYDEYADGEIGGTQILLSDKLSVAQIKA